MPPLQIVGTLKLLPSGQAFLSCLDGSEIPAAITGLDWTIDTLPHTCQCWSVIPKTGSDGTIATVKLWDFA
ncbi:MAG TPA: hypothetical protein V6D18_04885, partial [Thermosynechococcaceae cyanobacterium]